MSPSPTCAGTLASLTSCMFCEDTLSCWESVGVVMKAYTFKEVSNLLVNVRALENENKILSLSQAKNVSNCPKWKSFSSNHSEANLHFLYPEGHWKVDFHSFMIAHIVIVNISLELKPILKQIMCDLVHCSHSQMVSPPISSPHGRPLWKSHLFLFCKIQFLYICPWIWQ